MCVPAPGLSLAGGCGYSLWFLICFFSPFSFFLPTLGEEFYEASPYEPVTSRLSDIFRLASIFSGNKTNTLPLFYLLLPVNVDLLPSSPARKTYNSFPRGLALCSSSSCGHTELSPAPLFSHHPGPDALSIPQGRHIPPPPQQPAGMRAPGGGQRCRGRFPSTDGI